MIYLSKGGAGADSDHTWIRPCYDMQIWNVQGFFSRFLKEGDLKFSVPVGDTARRGESEKKNPTQSQKDPNHYDKN